MHPNILKSNGVALHSWKRLVPILSAFAAVVLPSIAHADLILNGSFEQGAPGLFFQVNAGGNELSPWNVTSGNIDVTSLSPDQFPQDGDRFIDIDGFYAAGTISQSFATVAGNFYDLSFYLSGNGATGFNPVMGSVIDPIKRIQVTVGDTTVDFSHDISNGFYWERKDLRFQAVSGTTTLEFKSLSVSNSAFGAFIDNVSVNSVPDSGATVSLVLIAVGGLIGGRRLRSRFL